MKEQIKKAFDLAENEVEDKEIQNFKNIIKNILQKLKDKEKEKDEIQEEIKLLKQDIDDFKSGRLDKIKERHDIEPKCNKLVPLRITIINDNRREIYPVKPWLWNYEVSWSNPIYLTSTGGNELITLCGSTTQNFTSGTYIVSTNSGNGIINL